MTNTRPPTKRKASARAREATQHAAAIDAVNGKKPKNAPGPPPAPRAKSKTASVLSTSSVSAPPSTSVLTPQEIELILAAREANIRSVLSTKISEKAVESSESDDNGLYELEEVPNDIYSRNMALLAEEHDEGLSSDDDGAEDPPHKRAKRSREAPEDGPTDVDMVIPQTSDNHIAPSQRPESTERDAQKFSHEGTSPVKVDSLSNGVRLQYDIIGPTTHISEIEFVHETVPKTPKKASGKIRRNDFTPRTRGLADESKNKARASVISQAYPASVEATEWAIIGGVVEGATTAPNGQVLQDAYQRATQDPEVQRLLLTYVRQLAFSLLLCSQMPKAGYGLTAIRTDLIRKARAELRKDLRLGKLDEDVVKRGVLWALKKKNYVFAGLDIEHCTNDRSKPFGFSIFESVIGEVCFGAGKVNNDAAQYMIAQRQVPLNLIGLVAAMIEHCLKEWLSGAHALSDFSDEIGRVAHAKNMRYVLKMQTRARKYMNKLQMTMLRDILRDQDKLYALEEDSDVPEEDFQGIDFDVLEKEAGSPIDTQTMDA
ncbi:hypothetical protein EV121DRAFT_214410 [Schizophyllum commune]